jgi:hypothetical protein
MDAVAQGGVETRAVVRVDAVPEHRVGQVRAGLASPITSR